MKKLFTFILLSSIFIFAGHNRATASHFAGADLTYVCLGGNSYQITLSFYRDCSGINAPTTAFVEFKCSSIPSFNVSAQLILNAGSGVEITPICNSSPTSCTTGPLSAYGIREYVYQGVITLPPCNKWTMSWSSCCRNPITTVNGSGGWYVSAELDNAFAPCNSSPTFANKPIIIVYNGQSFCYNQGASDIDGDSIAYSFFIPKTSLTTTVIYNSPYTYTNFLSSSSPITINSVTGDICFTPNQILNTICAIKVEEWRTINGTPRLIGVIHRDVQLKVINNTNNLPILSGIDTTLAHIYNVNDTIYNLDYCLSNSTISFDINGFDADTFNATVSGNPEEFSINWDSSIIGATFTPHYNSTDSAYAHFTWTPTINDVNTTKCFTATIVDESCPYYGSRLFTYCLRINDLLTNLGSDIELCLGENTLINSIADSSIVNFLWSLNGLSPTVPTSQTWYQLNSSLLGIGQHTLKLETNNGATTICTGLDILNINVADTPKVNGIINDTTFCDNLPIIFNAGNANKYFWRNTYGYIIDTNQYFQVPATGKYTITVDGGTTNKCIDSDTFFTTVLIAPPIVDFGNDTTISLNQTLSLSLPNGYLYYAWNTGATTKTIIIDSTYNWANNIIGIVTANNQCISTDTIIIYIGNVGFNVNSNDKVRIFPNPVSNSLNIELEKNYGELTMKILNQNGQMLKTNIFIGKSYKITDLDRLPKGVYYLQLTNKQVNLIFKFIKK